MPKCTLKHAFIVYILVFSDTFYPLICKIEAIVLLQYLISGQLYTKCVEARIVCMVRPCSFGHFNSDNMEYQN